MTTEDEVALIAQTIAQVLDTYPPDRPPTTTPKGHHHGHRP